MTLLVRERMPLRLHATVEAPSGYRRRWGPDERKPDYTLSLGPFSNTMPGGFEQASATLARKIAQELPDLEELAKFTIRGVGGQIAWQGRLEGSPRQWGDQSNVQPALVGYQAHLDDDNSAREIYADISLSNWIAASVQRKLNQIGSGTDIQDPSTNVDPATGFPALDTTVTGPSMRQVNAEAWYDANGISLGELYFAWKTDGNIDSTDPRWDWLGRLSSDDIATAIDSTASLRAAGPGRGSLLASAAGRKWAQVLLKYAASVPSSIPFQLFWTALGVYGNHGLTLQGAGDYQNPPGLLGSDIVAHAVSTWAPLLDFTVGPSGTIVPSTFVIPHLSFRDPGHASDIIKGATAYELQDWAVWDGPTFWWYPRGTYGRTWRARTGDCQLQETGPQIDRVWNGAIVTYCVDDETECLTKRGWRRHDELTPGDQLLAFNPDKRITRWEHPREIFVEPNYVGDMILLNGSQNRLGAFTTPDHRWPVYTRSRNGSPPKLNVRTSETLGDEGYLIRCAPYDAPASSDYRDEIVRLIAWYVTEGHLGHDGQRVTISQSRTANPEHVAAIRSDLEAIGSYGGRPAGPALCQWCEERPVKRSGRTFCSRSCASTARHAGFTPRPKRRGRRDGLWFTEYAYANIASQFRLSGTGVDAIIDAAPGKDKVPTMDFLLALTRPQLEMFVETCLKGDGYYRKRIFTQYHKGRMEAFTIAAVLAGKSPSLHTDGTACALNEVEYGTDLRELPRQRMPYVGTVWCPVTESGHWVARRRGKVFITGNSDITGATRSVGPPSSGCNTEDSSLLDTDPSNPCNQITTSNGTLRKWSPPLQMGTSTVAGAIKIGQTFLAEQRLLDTSGQATFNGYVQDDATGIWWPAWMVRSGDSLRIVDSNDPSARRIIRAEYDDSQKTCAVSLDSPPDGMQQLLARLSVALDSLGFS